MKLMDLVYIFNFGLLLAKKIKRKVPHENVLRATRCYLSVTMEFGNSILLPADFKNKIFIRLTGLHVIFNLHLKYQTDDCGGA